MAREWVVTDDLTGQRIVPAGMALRLMVLVDDTTELPATALLSLDVAPRPDDELLADLARHLTDREEVRLAARPLDPGPLGADVESATPAPDSDSVGDSGVAESAREEPSDAQQTESVQVTAPGPVDESAEDQPDAVDDGTVIGRILTGTQTGDADRGQPSTGVLRAWAHEHDLPCSTHGRINGHVRASYARVEGGTPDADAWTAAGIPADGGRPSLHPGSATDAAVRIWSQRAGMHPDTGAEQARAAYARAYRGQINGVALPSQPAQPAAESHIEPAGDGTRPRAEQLDRAREMASQRATPLAIHKATGVSLEDARRIVREEAS